MSYVILTSKPGQFRTELGAGVEPVESYDYMAHGRQRARFVIAQVAQDAKIVVVDETPPEAVNRVPAKFFPRFDTLEGARLELRHLADAAKGSSLTKL